MLTLAALGLGAAFFTPAFLGAAALGCTLSLMIVTWIVSIGLAAGCSTRGTGQGAANGVLAGEAWKGGDA